MKLNNQNILKSLFTCNEPISIIDFAELMQCDADKLSYYIEALKNEGLILESRHPFSEELRYSPKRFENLYAASPIAKEYLRKLKTEKLMFIFSAIAAIMATLTLIATLIIPFL